MESGIKYVKNNFFAERQFKDGDDLDRQLLRWLDKANQRVHGTIKKIPRDVFEEKEKTLLKTLPLEDFNLAKVGLNRRKHAK